MEKAKESLARAARQLIETDVLLGGEYMPAERNPLPARSPSAAPASAPRASDVLFQSAVAAPAPRAGAGAEPPRSPAAPAPGPSLSTEQKRRMLEEMDVREVRPCTKCRLHAGRTQTVFGEGSPDAALMFVGEGPGEDEDRQGRPFVGRAGQKLNDMIAAMGLKREEVFIANVVKCRPPQTRAPLPDEAATCAGLYLLRQIQIIRPQVIVSLGNPATQALLGNVLGITKIRGRWHKLGPLAEGLEGTPVMPTFHPSYLLRSYTQENRKAVWDDLQKVMVLLGLNTKRA